MRNYQSRPKVACACEDRRSLVKMEDHLYEDERSLDGRLLV